MIKPLTHLKPNDSGVICRHLAQGAIRQRLLDLGLMPNVEIQVVRYAPMGDPVEIKVGLTHVVIRATEAETIVVESE